MSLFRSTELFVLSRELNICHSRYVPVILLVIQGYLALKARRNERQKNIFLYFFNYFWTLTTTKWNRVCNTLHFCQSEQYQVQKATEKDGAKSVLICAALIAASHMCACSSSQWQCNCENLSPPLFMLWLHQPLNAFDKETFPSVQMLGCHRREFDSMAASTLVNASSPGRLPAQGCEWLTHQTPVVAVLRRTALISSLLCCPCNPKTSLFFFSFFHSVCQKPVRTGLG